MRVYAKRATTVFPRLGNQGAHTLAHCAAALSCTLYAQRARARISQNKIGGIITYSYIVFAGDEQMSLQWMMGYLSYTEISFALSVLLFVSFLHSEINNT